MIDYHKYVGYWRPVEKEKNRWEGGGGRCDEEKPVENKPVENKPVESGGTIQPIRPLGVEMCACSTCCNSASVALFCACNMSNCSSQ